MASEDRDNASGPPPLSTDCIHGFRDVMANPNYSGPVPGSTPGSAMPPEGRGTPTFGMTEPEGRRPSGESRRMGHSPRGVGLEPNDESLQELASPDSVPGSASPYVVEEDSPEKTRSPSPEDVFSPVFLGHGKPPEPPVGHGQPKPDPDDVFEVDPSYVKRVNLCLTLNGLHERGLVPRSFSESDDLREMNMALARYNIASQTRFSTRLSGYALIFAARMVEEASSHAGFGWLDLDGLSSTLGENQESWMPSLSEIAQKYQSSVTASPEMRFAMAIGGTICMVSMSNQAKRNGGDSVAGNLVNLFGGMGAVRKEAGSPSTRPTDEELASRSRPTAPGNVIGVVGRASGTARNYMGDVTVDSVAPGGSFRSPEGGTFGTPANGRRVPEEPVRRTEPPIRRKASVGSRRRGASGDSRGRAVHRRPDNGPSASPSERGSPKRHPEPSAVVHVGTPTEDRPTGRWSESPQSPSYVPKGGSRAASGSRSSCGSDRLSRGGSSRRGHVKGGGDGLSPLSPRDNAATESLCSSGESDGSRQWNRRELLRSSTESLRSSVGRSLGPSDRRSDGSPRSVLPAGPDPADACGDIRLPEGLGCWLESVLGRVGSLSGPVDPIDARCSGVTQSPSVLPEGGCSGRRIADPTGPSALPTEERPSGILCPEVLPDDGLAGSPTEESTIAPGGNHTVRAMTPPISMRSGLGNAASPAASAIRSAIGALAARSRANRRSRAESSVMSVSSVGSSCATSSLRSAPLVQRV